MGRAKQMPENPNPELRTDEQPEPVQTPQPVSEPAVPTTTNVPAPAADPHAEPDYKTKFAESTRENQILAAQLEQERAKTRRELTNQPTDSEVQAAFPEWEYMSDAEKRSARMAYNADRTARAIATEREAEKADRQWQNDLELYVAGSPDLEGKAREFKDYAQKPTHRGVPLETLRKAFLYDTPAPTPTPTPRTPGLESGTGGPKTPEKPKTISAEELQTLRKTDERAYREYITTHDLTNLEL